MQFLEIMKEYSIAVLIIAFIVCGLTALIKKFVPETHKKFLTFVPFILGIILYAAYAWITEGISEILKPDTLLSGFECGSVSTVYYVIFEQFLRNKKLPEVGSKEELTAMGILNNVIKPECLEEVSKNIVNVFKENLSEGELINECTKIIEGNTSFDLSKNEIKILVELIAKAN